MKSLLKPLAAALIAATSLAGIAVITASPAAAETVLRLDEVAVGELDPAKATDYADSMLMFNVYDTLVLSKQGGAGVVPHLAESWETDGKTYTFKLRTDVKFQSGNPLTADDVVFSLDRMKGIGQGLSYLFANVEKAEAVDAGTRQVHAVQPVLAVHLGAAAPADRRQEAGHGKPRRRRRRHEGLGPGLSVRRMAAAAAPTRSSRTIRRKRR